MNLNETSTHYIRTLIPTPEFMEFYNALPVKTQTKIEYVLDVMACVYNIPTKFAKHLETTEFYEMRVSVGNNEYRSILFAIDHTNIIEAKKIILLNGFLKKDTKDYRKHIEAARSILNKLKS